VLRWFVRGHVIQAEVTDMSRTILASVGLVAVMASALAAQKGEVMPAFEVTRWVTQKQISPKALKDRPYVVEFWATWCPPCRESVPHLAEMNSRYEPLGLVMVGLTSEPADKIEAIRRFAEQYKMNYYVGLNDELGGKLKVEGIPHAVVVGRDGRIAWQGHPMSPEFEPAAVQALAEWLFPEERFAAAAGPARQVVAGAGKEALANLRKLADAAETRGPAGEALKVLEKAAQARAKAAEESDEGPVARVLALEQVAEEYEGLAAANEALAKAAAIRAAETQKDPAFADEVSARSQHRKAAADLKRDAARASGEQGRQAQLRAILAALEKAAAAYDAILERYPRTKAASDVRREREMLGKSVEKLRRMTADR